MGAACQCGWGSLRDTLCAAGNRSTRTAAQSLSDVPPQIRAQPFKKRMEDAQPGEQNDPGV